MLNLNVYADLIFIALVGASLSNLLDDCFQDGMIFSFYGKWINSLDSFISKPLGTCLICFNVWITILMIAIYNICYPAFIILSIISISNTILKYIIK